MLGNCIYPIEVELSKLKKLSKKEGVAKEEIYKQIKEIKWKVYMLEVYMKHIENKNL